MSRPTQTAVERRKLLARLFPEGIPVLWCPLITHYNRDGAIDAPRMSAHLKHLAPHVQGLLIPGSTGDGWELNDDQARRLLAIALEQIGALNLHLLIGVLKTDPEEAGRLIADHLAWLGSRAGTGRPAAPDAAAETAIGRAQPSTVPGASALAAGSPPAILERGGPIDGGMETEETKTGRGVDERVVASLVGSQVSGFTVCPPRGKDLAQDKLAEALASILRIGAPTALYQLPQMTLNELHPERVGHLARQFPNFILFKDTSGADHVALSGQKLENVFLVRGAEGDYVRWLKVAKGPYDGFLLSTANCFGRQLHQLVEDLTARRMTAAQELSERLTSCINEVFGTVSGLPDGNAFANANKAMDHYFAWGPKARDASPPRLHAGSCLPADVIRGTGEALSRHGLMPEKGYLE